METAEAILLDQKLEEYRQKVCNVLRNLDGVDVRYMSYAFVPEKDFAERIRLAGSFFVVTNRDIIEFAKLRVKDGGGDRYPESYSEDRPILLIRSYV